jgi:hypothetical protein
VGFSVARTACASAPVPQPTSHHLEGGPAGSHCRNRGATSPAPPRTVPGGPEQADNDAATLFESDLPSLGDWRFGIKEAACIVQPVLYLLGSESEPLFGEGRDLLTSWLPRIESTTLPGATHLLQMQRPAGTAVGLADFLARHPMAA